MKKQIFTLVLLGLLCSVGSVWADETTTWAHGFEDGTAWNGSNTSNRAANADAKRTGGKGMYGTFSKGDSRLFKGGSVNYTNGNTYYAICWMKSTVAGKAGIGVAGAGGKDIDISADTWTRIYKKFTAGSDQTGKNIQPTISSSSSGTLYVDDIVWYKASGDVDPDFTAPSSPTSLSANEASISWTNGTDGNESKATGVQNTLVWKRTSGSSDDLSLNAQGLYTNSSKDQTGHWTLVDASVSAAATSFAGSFSVGDRYAIVHRDLAYNYSDAAYVTIEETSGHSISFDANGGSGSMASILGIENNGSQTLTLNSFTKSGYSFANWTADVAVTVGGSSIAAGGSIADGATITNITSDIALTAQWNAVDYDIVHGDASNGTYTIKVGDAAAVSTNTTANSGQTITLAATPADGYILSAWNVTAGGDEVSVTNNTFTMPAADVTIAPTFALVYTVTYNGNGSTGGSVPVDASSPYVSGSKVTVLGNTNSLTKTGYVFAGWNTEADESGTLYMPGATFNISANTILYAVWRDVSLTWNVQVNKEETTVTTSSTVSSNATYVAKPTDLSLTDLTVTASKKGTATNKISTTKAKGGYISATFAVQDGYQFIPTHMVLKTTAITEAITIEVNVGDEGQTWAQPKSSSDPDEHTYTFSDAAAYTGTVTMKIYAYGGSDGTKGYRLGTPIKIYGKVMPTSVSGTISAAGWSTFASSYPLDLSKVTATSGASAYYASAVNGSTVTLTPTGNVTVPAGEGLMIKGTAGETFTIDVAESGTAIDGNLLKGQTTTGNVAASPESGAGTYHYVFGYSKTDASEYGFYNLAATTSVPAGKAYLELTVEEQGAPSIIRIVDEENNATSIEALGSTEKAVKFIENGQLYILREGVVYDALGRKVR